MTKIKYQRLKGVFLTVSFTDEGTRCAEMIFDSVKSATLILDGRSYAVIDGKLKINLSEIKEGCHVPILKTDTESIICDKIRISAGKIEPDIKTWDRLFFLTEEVGRLWGELTNIKEKTEDLTRSVYGNKIF